MSVDRVVLIGFMGAGKTTVGQLLAGRLGWAFLDSDSLVEERLRLSVPEIFAELGEAAFREAERAVMKEALAKLEAVVSTGGGWPEPPGTIEALPEGTLSVWLDAPLEELLRRVRGQSTARPLLEVTDRVDRAQSLLARRAPRYARAQMHLNTAGRDPATVADAIVRRVRDQALSERPETT